jgi:hypothetical protein
MQGGQRRSAIYGSLNWKHGDIQSFMNSKNHSPELRAAKELDFNFPLPLELTNISVNYDTEFFVAIENTEHPLHKQAMDTFMQNCKQAFSTAEPGMSYLKTILISVILVLYGLTVLKAERNFRKRLNTLPYFYFAVEFILTFLTIRYVK